MQDTKLTNHPRPRTQVKVFILASLTIVSLFSASSQCQTVLHGSAKYAENAGALDPLLGPGNILDKDAARGLLRDPSQESTIWAQIPEWEAGDWASNQAVNTRAVKYANGVPVDVQPLGPHTSIGKFNKGYLHDARGGVWHLFKSDYWTETTLEDCTLISYIVFCSPGSGEYPDFYAESVDFKVSKPTMQILTVRKAKTWMRYTNLAPGTLKEESIRTNFDPRGQATATTYNTALAKLTAPMSSYEKSFASNPKIVKSFHDYLHSHGMDVLIPKPASTAR